MSIEPDRGSYLKVMASMGLGVSDPLRPPYNEEWTKRGEDITPHISKLISPAERQVFITTGHPNLDLFGQPQVTGAMREALGRGAEVTLLFGNKSLGSVGDATALVRNSAKGLADLKQDYPDTLHLLWNLRPIRLDVVVVDGAHVINADPEVTFADQLGVVITKGDQKWGEHWVKKFSLAIMRSTEINP